MQQVQPVEMQQSYLCMLTGVHGWEQQSSSPPVSPGLTPSQKFALRLTDVRFDGTFCRLSSPLCVLLSVEEGFWRCEDEGHHIVSFGDASETALHSFCEDFVVLWKEIANAPDSDLTPDAQQVKKFLVSTVQTVKPE